MARACAVVGVGQTRHAAKRGDLSMVGLVREAAIAALEDAGLTWKDVEALVIGKAPDMFEGVMQPELFLADALGATGKPMIRVHTAGSVGGSTAIVAAHLVQSGQFSRVLTVAFEKPSPVPAATSRRSSARTSIAPRRRPTSGCAWRSRTGRTRCAILTRTCTFRTSTWRRSRTRRCCGIHCIISNAALRRTGPAR
jgi:acetyl-CoA acetyltransferase